MMMTHVSFNINGISGKKENWKDIKMFFTINLKISLTVKAQHYKVKATMSFVKEKTMKSKGSHEPSRSTKAGQEDSWVSQL